MNTKEIWKPVAEAPESYEVSNFGRVRSIPRTIQYYSPTSGNIISRDLPGKVLKHNVNVADRHHRVPIVMPIEGVPYTTKYRLLDVGRLVATAFLEAPENGAKSVKYKDGNPENLHVDNLEWNSAGNPVARAIIDHTARCEYPSISDCAKILGVYHTTVIDKINRGEDIHGHALSWKHQ